MFIFLGSGALEYHVAKYRPPEDAIQIFLNNLPFPLSVFYNGSHYNFLTSSKKIGSIEYLRKATLYHSIGMLILGSITPLIVISVYYRGVSESVNTQQLLSYWFWLIAECATVFRVYRFGHKLVHIDKSLPNRKIPE
jgi:hypothetical protein